MSNVGQLHRSALKAFERQLCAPCRLLEPSHFRPLKADNSGNHAGGPSCASCEPKRQLGCVVLAGRPRVIWFLRLNRERQVSFVQRCMTRWTADPSLGRRRLRALWRHPQRDVQDHLHVRTQSRFAQIASAKSQALYA